MGSTQWKRASLRPVCLYTQAPSLQAAGSNNPTESGELSDVRSRSCRSTIVLLLSSYWLTVSPGLRLNFSLKQGSGIPKPGHSRAAGERSLRCAAGTSCNLLVRTGEPHGQLLGRPRNLYDETGILLRITTFDRRLWYNPDAAGNDLTSWDAATVYLGPGSNTGSSPREPIASMPSSCGGKGATRRFKPRIGKWRHLGAGGHRLQDCVQLARG